MIGKKGQSLQFMGLNITHLVVGAVISVFIASLLFNAFKPDVAEASSRKVFDDFAIKAFELEEGGQTTAYGTLFDDNWLVGFESNYEQLSREELYRPKQCGSEDNSCICLCKDGKCNSAIECKPFRKSKFSRIVFVEEDGDERHLKLEGEKSISAKLRVVGDALRIEEIGSS